MWLVYSMLPTLVFWKIFVGHLSALRMGFSDEAINWLATVVTPGAQHPWTFHIMNFALIGLMLVLLLVVVLGAANIHHYILLGMSAILFALIHWFLHELELSKREEAAKEKLAKEKETKKGK